MRLPTTQGRSRSLCGGQKFAMFFCKRHHTQSSLPHQGRFLKNRPVTLAEVTASNPLPQFPDWTVNIDTNKESEETA